MKEIVNLLFETGQLRKIVRSGWWLAGIKHPETVAEHSHRAAILTYFLAKLENVNVEKCIMMTLFHDLPETRINDIHKVGQRYLHEHSNAESEALREQMSNLNIDLSHDIVESFNDYEAKESPEANVARDADLIEAALTAKEYIEQGHKSAQDWINNVRKVIKTDSAKQMLDIIENTNSTDWWKNLKKISR